MMKTVITTGLILIIVNLVKSLPYDDGKYNPKKYRIHDDGKYYRPLDEGKYIPGDEGRYTYIYRQGLYPGDDGDYRYIHEEGPRGPDGSFENSGGRYLGHKIYAAKYKHLKIDNWADGLVDRYISTYDYGNNYNVEQSKNYYKRLNTAEIGKAEEYRRNNLNCSSLWDKFIIDKQIYDERRLVTLYKVTGEKELITLANGAPKKLVLVYNSFIKIYEGNSDKNN